MEEDVAEASCSQPPKGSSSLLSLSHFLAPTGALEEGILCVRACVRQSVRPSLSSKEHWKGALESLRRGSDKQAGKQSGKQAGKQVIKQSGKKVSKQAGKQASKQASRLASKQASN